MGLERYDAASIFGFNSPEWIMGEVSTILAGGIAAGIYPTDTPAQVGFKAKHSGSTLAIVENIAKARVFLDQKENLPVCVCAIVLCSSNFLLHMCRLNETIVSRFQKLEAKVEHDVTFSTGSEPTGIEGGCCLGSRPSGGRNGRIEVLISRCSGVHA